jgi:hypothetical protein
MHMQFIGRADLAARHRCKIQTSIACRGRHEVGKDWQKLLEPISHPPGINGQKQNRTTTLSLGIGQGFCEPPKRRPLYSKDVFSRICRISSEHDLGDPAFRELKPEWPLLPDPFLYLMAFG